MTLSMYQASIPVFTRGLRVLSALLDKGAAHAAAAGSDPDLLAGARLAPDMLTLVGQVQRASDSAKLAGARLTGLPAPAFEDTETTLAELQARIAKTIAYLEGIDAAALDGSDTRAVEVRAGGASVHFQGAEYLLSFALPNFFFHVTTAYDVLRHAGVAVGKRDYLGSFGQG